MPKVSLCMIVKNEEKNLPDCLASCADLVDEIIIVDTGSADRTKEIAARYGARLFDFPWVDSFAAARNESVRHATGEWIFWMDADDRIDQENRDKLRALFAGLGEEIAAYMMICRVLSANAAKPIRVVDHARLFRNDPRIRWQYRVHEQILPAVMRAGGAMRRTDIVICHMGYLDESLGPGKLQRNTRLMEMDFQDQPNDPFLCYNLGRSKERQGKLAEALVLWQRSLAHSPPGETFVAKLYFLLAQGHYQRGQRAEALIACLGGLARFPGDVELLLLASTVLMGVGDLPAAEACLLRLLSMPREALSMGDDPGLRTFKARTQLGRIYRDQRRLGDAEAQWRAALQEDASFPQTWLGLGQIFLDQSRWDELEEAIGKLEANPNGRMEGAVLRGLRHVVRKETAEARKLMEATAGRYPQATEPLVLLMRLLMQDQDYAAAERVARRVLVLDPTSGEAQQRLKQIQSRTQ